LVFKRLCDDFAIFGRDLVEEGGVEGPLKVVASFQPGAKC